MNACFKVIGVVVVVVLCSSVANAANIIAQWNLDENPITVGTTQAANSVAGGPAMTYKTTAAPVAGYWGAPEGAVDFASNGNPSGYAVTANLGANAYGIAYGQSVSTVEFFFKLDSIRAIGQGLPVEFYDEGIVGSPLLSVSASDDKFQANWNWTGWGSGATITADPIVAGKWYYGAAQFVTSTGQVSVFLYDSVTNPTGLYTAVSTTAPTGAKTKTPYAYIGTNFYNGPGTTPGTIDNVTIYDAALDQATMLNHATVIPEPGTLVLLGAGLVGLLCYAWRKRR